MENNNLLDNDVSIEYRNVFIEKASAKLEDNISAGIESEDKADNKQNQGDKVMENSEAKTVTTVTEAAKADVQPVQEQVDAQAVMAASLAALETEKASLAQKIEELSVANQGLTAQTSELELSKSELAKQLEALASEKDSAMAELGSVKAELETLKKEQVTASRISQLSAAEILVTDEEVKKKQIAKISEMSDEQFVDYVSELQAIAKKCGTKKVDEASAAVIQAEAEKAEASIVQEVKDSNHAGSRFAQAFATVQPSACTADKVSTYSQM
jgi:hypothetical protein